MYTTFRTAGSTTVWSDSACTSNLPLMVLDTSTVNYGGMNLKQYSLIDTAFTHIYTGSNIDTIKYLLVERIGVVNMYHFINTLEPPSSCYIPTDYYTVTLGRYSDDSFSHVFEVCGGVGVNNQSDNQNSLFVHPNPATSHITISNLAYSAYKKEIQIYNMNSQKVKSFSTQEAIVNIDIRDLPEGLYLVLIRINTDEGNGVLLHQKFYIMN